jgi:hypothetical protein
MLMTALFASAALAAAPDSTVETQRGWLGVYTEPLSRPMQVALSVESGVLVTEVAEQSPAAKAGIEMGDVILSVDGQSTAEPSALRRVVRERPGRKVEVQLRRKGKDLRVGASLEARAASEAGDRSHDFEWRGAPLEALRQARKAIREINPRLPGLEKTYRESVDSLRQELEGLKQEIEQLRVQVKGKEKRD